MSVQSPDPGCLHTYSSVLMKLIFSMSAFSHCPLLVSTFFVIANGSKNCTSLWHAVRDWLLSCLTGGSYRVSSSENTASSDKEHDLLCLPYTPRISCSLIIPVTQDYISVPKESLLMLEDIYILQCEGVIYNSFLSHWGILWCLRKL